MPRPKVPKKRGAVKAGKPPKQSDTRPKGQNALKERAKARARSIADSKRALQKAARERLAREKKRIREFEQHKRDAEREEKRAVAEYAKEQKRIEREGLRVIRDERKAQEKRAKLQAKYDAMVERKRQKAAERIGKGVRRTLKRAKKLLKKEGLTREEAAMSRHTVDSEGFVDLTSPKKLSRSEAAKKGWFERKVKKFRAQGVSHFGAQDWAGLSAERADALEKLTQDVLVAYAWTYGPMRHRFVKTALETGDRRFVVFMALAQQMGYTLRQARTALFSPRARPSIG